MGVLTPILGVLDVLMPPGAWLSPGLRIIGAGPASHLSYVTRSDKVHLAHLLAGDRPGLKAPHICGRIRLNPADSPNVFAPAQAQAPGPNVLVVKPHH